MKKANPAPKKPKGSGWEDAKADKKIDKAIGVKENSKADKKIDNIGATKANSIKATKIPATKLRPQSDTTMNIQETAPPQINGINHYVVHSAAQDIVRAEQHKQNPKLMKAVKSYTGMINQATDN
jgi:hypothetical protein